LIMSVPLTLLGLLERGPSHGYDLKRDYDAYFGRGRPLRYSQVYATLSRLARDGKAVAGPVEKEAGPEDATRESLGPCVPLGDLLPQPAVINDVITAIHRIMRPLSCGGRECVKRRS